MNTKQLGIYMYLRNHPQQRKWNSEAKAAEPETLPLSYPQVLGSLNCFFISK